MATARRRTYPAFAVACLLALSIDARAATDEREELLDLLEEQTDLATRTRLNADYVPGIITLLHGNDLASRGARTVWDALSFVPGINPVLDQSGHRRLIVRGLGAIGDSDLSGNVKILLNGVAMNSAERGFAESVYYLPIEQIDRIEVIRGPGSAIHGENAVAGVLNVITRSEGQRAYGSAGSFGQLGGGAVLSTSRSAPVQLTLNLGAWKSDGADVTTGRDALYQLGPTPGQHAGVSNAPGEANEGIESRSVIAELGSGPFSLLGQWAEHRIGDYFGVNYVLPPDSDHLVETNGIRSLEARYRDELRIGRLNAFLGTTRNRVSKRGLYAYPLEIFGISSPPSQLIDSDYEEQRNYGGIELSRGWADHQLLFGWYGAEIEVLQARQECSFDPYNTCFYPVPENTTRRIRSAVVQDEYRATDSVSLTAGARYDHYEGIGTTITPRLAAVWRAGEQRIIKAQYGRAFRPPTLSEQGAKPVTANAWELGYIEKSFLGEWRVTAYYSELKNLIAFDSSLSQFRNGSAILRGIELEGSRRFGSRTELSGSIAFSDSSREHGEPIPGSSDWIARAGAKYRLDEETQVAFDYRQVSGFARQQADPRPSMDGFGELDATLTFSKSPGWSLRTGLKNLLNQDVRYPAFLGDDIPSGYAVTYPQDLPRPGRTWWLSFSYDF